jgi:hypothetical protein
MVTLFLLAPSGGLVAVPDRKATDIDGYRSATPIAGDESPKFLQRRFFRTPKAEVRNGKPSTWIRKRYDVTRDL